MPVVDIRKGLRIDELMAYCVLTDLFQGRDVVLGDRANDKMPDISCADGRFGVECTLCERDEIYHKYRTKYLSSIKKDFNIHNLFVPFIKNDMQIKPGGSYDEARAKDEILQQFKFVLYKKLNKLNRDSYAGVRKKFLFINSNFEHKPIDIQEFVNVIKKANSNYHQKFSAIFIFYNNKLYEVTCDRYKQWSYSVKEFNYEILEKTIKEITFKKPFPKNTRLRTTKKSLSASKSLKTNNKPTKICANGKENDKSLPLNKSSNKNKGLSQ